MLSAQCYNYETIDDESRNIFKPIGMGCDQSVFNSTSRWVRFVGAGGTQIPTARIGPSQCGTQATGWYSGEMPTITDSTTSGDVCFEWQSNICRWRSNISVTNCGSYYVYQLSSPPECSLRYCTTNPQSIMKGEKSTSTFTLSNFILNILKKLKF